MKKIVLLFVFISLISCHELQQVISQLPQQAGSIGLSNAQIGSGLREALNKGIDKQVSKLTATDGFFKNQLVKIVLPSELQKVDKTLRNIGMSSLADQGLKVLNRAAENAVKEATPIFVNAVKGITFADAKNILLGADNSATNYLSQKTTSPLYSKFKPVINSSLAKVGATKVWSNIITKYNAVPLTSNVNPDLTDYVTNQALKGVYKMIAVEEKEIRTKMGSRTTDLLRKVFALQD